MAEHAFSTPAPSAAPLTLWRLRSLFIFADAAREIVDTVDQDDALRTICHDLIDRMIAAPVASVPDATGKLWLIGLIGERQWDFDRFMKPCLAQVVAFVRGARS